MNSDTDLYDGAILSCDIINHKKGVNVGFIKIWRELVGALGFDEPDSGCTVFSSDDDQSSIADSCSSSDEIILNPATGLIMVNGVGGIDVAGNPYGVDLSHDVSYFSADEHHDTLINPATGFEMIDGDIGGIDSGGSTFGHNILDEQWPTSQSEDEPWMTPTSDDSWLSSSSQDDSWSSSHNDDYSGDNSLSDDSWSTDDSSSSSSWEEDSWFCSSHDDSWSSTSDDSWSSCSSEEW